MNVFFSPSATDPAITQLHPNATCPARGWGQRYSGDTALWNRLIACGHSQGGSMAAMLAKTRVTNRGIMFGSRDWRIANNCPYNWMLNTSQTPVDRWFLFAHERDEKADLSEMQLCAAVLDVTRHCAHVRVESSNSAGYNGRHFLSTDLESSPVLPGRHHGSLVADAITPPLIDGVTPIFKPVWDYLRLHDTPPIADVSTGGNASFILSPGTLLGRRFRRLRFPTP